MAKHRTENILSKYLPKQIFTYPIRLGNPPLNLIYFSLCSSICEDRILYCSRHLLNIPDESLNSRKIYNLSKLAGVKNGKRKRVEERKGMVGMAK